MPAGAVWVDVLPSLRGWNSAVRTQAKVSLTGVGEEAGRSWLGGMRTALSSGKPGAMVAAQMKAMADEGAAATERASTKVQAAMRKQAEATDAVTVAQKRLDEMQSKYGAESSQVAAAQARLNKANLTAVASTEAVTKASTEHSAALAREGEYALKAGSAAESSSRRFSIAATSMHRSSSRLTEGFKGMRDMALGMAGFSALFAVGGFAASSLKGAVEFQKATSVLHTAAEENVKLLPMIRSGILNISADTGQSLTELTDGMYVLEKAGMRGAGGLNVLKWAARGADEEGTHLSTMTNALSSIMTSYGYGTGKAANVMNALATASGAAKTNMEEFAGSLSTVLPIAAANRISFAKVAGALGTLTSHGTTAFEAAQELAFSIRSLSAPNMVAIKEMGQLGIASNSVSRQLGKRGIAGTVQYLAETVMRNMGPSGMVLLNTFYKSTSAGADMRQMLQAMAPAARQASQDLASGAISSHAFSKAIKNMPEATRVQAREFKVLFDRANGFNMALRSGLPGTQTFTDAMKKMMGGSAGLNTALMLLGGNMPATNRRIQDIAHSMNDAQQATDRWGITKGTAAVALNRSEKAIQGVGVRLATTLLPPLAKAATATADFVSSISNFSSKNWGWVKPLGEGLGVIAGALLAIKTTKGVLSFAAGGVRDLRGLLSPRTLLGGGGVVGKLERAAGVVPVFVTNEGFGGPGGVGGKPGSKVPPILGKIPKVPAAVGLGIGSLALTAGTLGEAKDSRDINRGRTFVGPGSAAFSNQMDKIARVMKGGLNVGLNIAITAASKAALSRYRGELKSLPKQVRTEIATHGIPKTQADMKALQARYHLTPKQVETLARLRDLTPPTFRAVMRSLGVLGAQRPTPTVGLHDNASGPIAGLYQRLVALASTPWQVNVAAKTVAMQGRAIGGPVEANTPYIVGEHGPELYVPKQDGHIETAAQTAMILNRRLAGSYGRSSAGSAGTGDRMYLVLDDGSVLNARIRQVSEAEHNGRQALAASMARAQR